MAPVDERPLTPGVRTEASLNNSMKRPRGREEDKKKGKKKRLGVSSRPALIQLWHPITVSISDTNAVLMSPADNAGLTTGMCQEGQGVRG